jgi:hypothetical protein
MGWLNWMKMGYDPNVQILLYILIGYMTSSFFVKPELIILLKIRGDQQRWLRFFRGAILMLTAAGGR